MTEQPASWDFDYHFKIVVIGDSGAGKSNLVLRYTKNEFSLETQTTIGVELAPKTVKVDGKIIKAQLWDTAGQERFQALASAYFKGAIGALLVYDITKPSSFKGLEKWIEKLQEHADPNITTLLVGNKCDLSHLREVRTEDAEEFAQKHNMAFLETSALENTNVELAFQKLVAAIYERVKNSPLPLPDLDDRNKRRKLEPETEKEEEKNVKRGCC